MACKIFMIVGLILTIVVAYLLVWPVPVKPVAWQAPVAPGYVGPFAQNERLKDLESASTAPWSEVSPAARSTRSTSC